MGAPITLDDLVYKPQNSLIHQSYKAQERAEPLNGDGFGIGWYDFRIDETPAVFTSIRPAWNNRNLRSIAPKIRSTCIFAHVRAASMGDVTQENCHPFRYKNLLFMHNGDIRGFRKIRRMLRRRLSDEIYDWVQGDTDSEHFFALFLNRLAASGKQHCPELFLSILEEVIEELQQLSHEADADDSMSLNVVVSNGRFAVATKYVSDSQQKPNTLYYSSGSRFLCRDGVCHMLPTDSAEHAVLIVSEKLTQFEKDWHEVPVNHAVSVSDDLSVSVEPIKVSC